MLPDAVTVTAAPFSIAAPVEAAPLALSGPESPVLLLEFPMLPST